MVRKYLFSGLFILLNLLSVANAADIRVFVDRENISINESFNLVFEATGSVDDDPDFSPLAVYFDVLNQRQSSNMTIINGNYSRKKVWTLVLLAKQAGAYAIPSIEFGKDKSPGLNIKVIKNSTPKSAANSNLFLEVEIDQKTAYVQAQLLYTVRVFRSVDIQNASLTEPALSDADAIVEKLGEDKRYQTTRNGVRFVVIERRYAIFPQQSGELTIKPLDFNTQIVSQQRSFFDLQSLTGTTKRLQSKQIKINIKPVPVKFKNKNWLPSTEVKLVDEWPEDAAFKVGEPVTRTLSLLAFGLTAAQLPEISIKDITHVKQYPDQATLNDHKDENGITGIRQEKIAFIPTRAGKITLPEINIPWWNTSTGQLEYARLASKNITVEAGAQTQATPVIPQQQSRQQKTDELSIAVDTDQALSVWFYISLLLLTGWVGNLLYLLPLKRNSVTDTSHNSAPPTGSKNISKKFASACHQNNKALCKTLLIEWARQQWPDEQINSLAEICLKVDSALSEQINILNQQLYSGSDHNWSAEQLLSAFQSYRGKPLNSKHKPAAGLKPISKLV